MVENMNVEIGSKYIVNGMECEVLTCNKEKEILFLKEQDGTLAFVLGTFKVTNGNEIIANNKTSFTVSEAEMLESIEVGEGNYKKPIAKESIVSIVQNKYHQIPTTLAEEIAEWYMK
jgi:hypothetical protein